MPVDKLLAIAIGNNLYPLREAVEVTMKPKIRPVGDRLLVKTEEVPEKSKGGIYFPDTAREKEKPRRGVILAMGPSVGSGKAKPEYAIEDEILFSKYAGIDVPDVPDSGGKLIIIKEDEVLGVIEA